MEQYLHQQQQQIMGQNNLHNSVYDAPGGSGGNGGAQLNAPQNGAGSQQAQYVVPFEQRDTISMDEFKSYVKRWFDTDNYVKRAQQIIKEKRKEKNQLSEVIMKFMCKYNIEDLNTKEGRIRCKNVYVKAPVSKDVVKQCISDYFPHDEEKKEEIIHKIYDNREKVEKTTLRRLKIS
jgi:hypothetical protein